MRKIYPIGIQTFADIVESKLQYIDKTGYVFDLANKYRYVFLSRPRRFGKSLLTSTFHSFFEGRKDLFEGLAAGRLEKDWVKHPVLHFDISTAKHQTLQGLHNTLDYLLSCEEEKYGIEKKSDDENLRLSNLIQGCYNKYGERVVVLIDEYDAPLLDVLNDEKRLEANRQVMRNFYSPLKACDPMLRFVFITGITKFSQLSIFSELNNLQNISMMDEYAAICGITSEELLTQFSDNLDDFAARAKISREETIAKLKAYYDGYHFSENSPDIYNPFSLIKALDGAKLEAYWFSSGTPTYLIEQMRKFGVRIESLGKMEAMRDEFDVPTESMMSITPLLYQSGYITIKGYDKDYEAYTLDIPNREVRSGLMKSMIPYVAGNGSQTPFFRVILDMQRAFDRDDTEGVMEGLKKFFSAIPKADNTKKNYEGYYQSLLFVAFSMLCQYTDVEVRTPQGRADLVMNARHKIYIVEVKIDKNSAFALSQIDLKDYGERFLIQGKPVVKVGVNFDSEQTHNITDWQVVED